jgi:hypothetical protein
MRDLARFDGMRLTLNEITSAAMERGILQPLPADGASSFGNRRNPLTGGGLLHHRCADLWSRGCHAIDRAAGDNLCRNS